jgi:hypothetical protein
MSFPLVSMFFVSCNCISRDDNHDYGDDVAGNPPVFMADGGFKDRLGARTHTYIYACTHTYKHIHIYTYTHTHTYIHTYIHTHTHTHTFS